MIPDMQMPMAKRVYEPEANKGSFNCPQDGTHLSIPLNFSIQNLPTISMLLWTHENPVVCPKCGSSYMPVLKGVDMRAVSHGIVKLDIPPITDDPKRIIIA